MSTPSERVSACQFEPGYAPETDTQQLRSDIDVTLSAMSTERVVKLPLEPKSPTSPTALGVRASVAEAADNPVSSRGFRAQLSDMTLADLIQMKCLSGTHECFRVKSSLRQGILVFDAGQVVHARTGHLEGDAAVLSMLAWETGSIQPEAMPPELRRSVKSGWQSLLMYAAQARDEGRELVSREASGSLTVDVDWEEEMKGLQHQDSMLRRLGFSPAVHIDAQGTVIERIGDTDELESVVALATRLANLAGEELGLDALNAFEARVGSRVCIVYQDRDGSFFGILADGHDDLSELRKTLNL